MAVTLKDIAMRTQLTPSAVSKILSPKGGRREAFSEETCRRVQQVAAELGYRPSFSGRSLAKGRTYTIGFQCGNIRSAYYGELAELAMKWAEARGYHLTIQITPWQSYESDLDCLDVLLRRGVDGVVFFGEVLQPGQPMHAELVRRRFPIVVVNDEPEGLCSVTSDFTGGMRQVAEELHGRGFSSVIYVCDSHGQSNDWKFQALRAGCDRLQMTCDWLTCGGDEPAVERFVRGAESLAERFAPRQAIVVQSDQTAAWVMKGLRAKGLRIPDDYALVGVDGTDLAEYCDPQLASVACDKDAMMKYAIDLVVAMIEGQDVERVVKRFPTQLIVRDSMGPVLQR